MRIILPIVLLLAGAPALAQPPARSVHYADLDLATAAGIARLDRRIAGAIDQLCGSAAPADLDSQAAIQGCRAATWNDLAARRATLVAAARTGSGAIASASR